MKPVARAGDVQATPSGPAPSAPFTGEGGPATGTWTAGPVTETLLEKAGSDGSRVVRAATCTFSFTGPQNADPKITVTGTSTVTLEPQSRTLTVDGHHPLVDGDEERDDDGNTLSVSSSATWRTA